MSLAPEHIADLARSGLATDLIATLQCEAVRPHDIKIQGVTSAYRLPYFALDGTRNCFERWRLFPVIQRPDGSKQKYHQPAGSDPSLYLPPLLPWNTVAAQPSSPILIVEGEKKAAAGCMKGLSAIGIGGLWNWRQRLDNGDRLVIPTIDLFQWADREVLLVPDSDAWRAGREIDLLAGFYTLGQELISRGAMVLLLQLPERGSVKVGLDDWLVSVDAEWESLWPHLKRIALDDKRLKKIASWWARWRERHATSEALKTMTAEELEVLETVGLYTVRVPKHSVTVLFDRLVTDQRGLRAEVTVVAGSTELIAGVELSLQSTTGQANLEKDLKAYTTNIPWRVLLQRACALVVRRHRRGEPLSVLNSKTVVEPLTFALNPIVPCRKPTIVFGDGGKGKSTLVLFWGMMVSTGRSVAGFSALPGKVLLLDWEDDIDVHARRLHAIRNGHPELDAAEVQYQRCSEPLVKIIHEVARTVQRDSITMVLIDSLLMAMGGDSSAEAVGKFFAGLRVLRTESLAVGHIPKPQGDGAAQTTVYGSIFNQNLARSVWELKTEQEVGENQALLALVHRKSNLTCKHPPIGLKVTYTPDNSYLYYEPFDLAQAAELEKALPMASRIRNLLEDGIPRSAQEIAVALGEKPDSVSVTLSRHKRKKWSQIGENRDAQWTCINR